MPKQCFPDVFCRESIFVCGGIPGEYNASDMLRICFGYAFESDANTDGKQGQRADLAGFRRKID